MEKIFDIAGQDAALEVYRDKIVIKRKGLISALNMREDKTILISAIRSMDVKKPSFLTVGWITFGTGGRERTEMFGDGLFTQFGNDTFSFAKTSYEEVLKAKEYLETKIGELHRPLQVTSASSGADELRKFKGLLDDGIISEAEYAEKKKQLLGGAELNSSVADLDLEKTRDTEAKKRAEQQKLVKQLGIEEQDFGQGYKVSGQKFYDLEDAIAYAQQQIEREKKAHTNPLVANKPPSESLDLPSAQDAHKGDKSQEPIVPQENYSWRREEAAVDSQQKKSNNTFPIFLGISAIVAAVFWRLGTETGGTTEKKDTVKPFTTKPYSQLRAEMGKDGWQPYIARDNKDQCDLKYQEVNFCSEDLSCTAEFLDGSNKQIAKINFRICKSAINNCVSWGEYPDGFELVVSKELKSLKTPVETYLCDL